jgi:extracellular elastinolytic metalloproteinase
MARHRGVATSRRVLLLTVFACLVLLAPSAGQAVTDIPEIHGDTAPAVDTRTTSVAPTAAQEAAAARIGGELRWNEFGTPQSLVEHGGFIARGIEADSAAAAARSWLDANKALFRLSSLASLEVESDVELAGSDGHAVVFHQTLGGLTASPDGVLVVGVVGTAKRGFDVAYVSSRVTGDTTVAGTAELSAVEAWVEAAQRVGEDVSTDDVRVAGRDNGWTRLDVEGFSKEQSVRAAAFPTPAKGPVRTFETILVRDEGNGHAEGYWQFVDASSGRVLFRESVVDHAVDNPTWDVFPAYPQLTRLNRYPWNFPSADTRELWCWTGAPGCRLEVANPASPQPWDVEGTGAVSFTTSGNNARAQENWLDSFFPGGSTQPPPTSPTRDYLYPWENVWFEEECNPAVLVPGGNDIDAATVNLFAMHNRMHDWSFHLGFDTEHWNAQDNNYGTGTAQNDRILGNVQAGAITGGYPTYSGRDNANMFTQPDGTPSWTNMYLWQPLAGAFYAPCVDGDYDMAVIGHEYGHMIENRMIGKGDRRQGAHAGAMGESFGDLNGMEYLNEYNEVPVGGENPYSVGAYVTGNAIRGIRNYGMNFPSAGQFPQPGKYSEINPLNFSDVGYDITGPQVHADGEIWSATNFGIRDLFLDRYRQRGQRHQVECADGERPAEDCPGNRRWMQLYYDAMVLMPVAPTFLDARDAILAADVMRFGGANQDLLWYGFARRGFGQNAVTAGPNDGDPIPDFESPLHQEGTVTFNAVSQETGEPVNADIFVGHYEARATTIADTDPATGGPNRDNVARFVTDRDARGQLFRAWEFVANAAGYGHVRFRLNELRPGENRTVTIEFPTNHASVHQGAVATGDGDRHDDLVDDTESTNWESTGAPVEGRQVLVDLSGAEPVRFRGVKVSAALLTETIIIDDEPRQVTQNRFTALRAFEVYACTAGADPANADCAADTTDGWKRILKSQDDAFPGDNPRPVAPTLILRSWSVPTTTATHVLFRVVDNQCTGQESFQGEQDQDPNNVTDCRTGTPGVLPPRNTEVRAAEFQVLSDKPNVAGAEQEE